MAATQTARTPTATSSRSRRGTDVRQRRAQVGVRLLPEEMEQLRRIADRERVSPAEVLRRAFLSGRPA